MAQRRMFSMRLADTDRFLDLPLSTQALYFHLGLRADDDGFISNPRRLLKLLGAKEGDLKLLLDQGYLLGFGSGVMAITHWRVNNLIRRDRYTPTSYREEAEKLYFDEQDRYTLEKTDRHAPDFIFGNQMATQDRLGKDREGEDSSAQDSSGESSPDEDSPDEERESDGETESGGGGTSRCSERARESAAASQAEGEVDRFLVFHGLEPELVREQQPEAIQTAKELADKIMREFAGRAATPVDTRHVLDQCFGVERWSGRLIYDKRDAELLMFCFQEAADAGHAGEWNYVLGTLKRLRQRGVHNIVQAELDEDDWERMHCR